MTQHKARNTAAVLAGADTSAAMPYPTQHPTEAMQERRTARLWKTAGAIAYLEDDPGAFRELMEACGLLVYESGQSPKPDAGKAPVIKYNRPGQR